MRVELGYRSGHYEQLFTSNHIMNKEIEYLKYMGCEGKDEAFELMEYIPYIELINERNKKIFPEEIYKYAHDRNRLLCYSIKNTFISFTSLVIYDIIDYYKSEQGIDDVLTVFHINYGNILDYNSLMEYAKANLMEAILLLERNSEKLLDGKNIWFDNTMLDLMNTFAQRRSKTTGTFYSYNNFHDCLWEYLRGDKERSFPMVFGETEPYDDKETIKEMRTER